MTWWREVAAFLVANHLRYLFLAIWGVLLYVGCVLSVRTGYFEVGVIVAVVALLAVTLMLVLPPACTAQVRIEVERSSQDEIV